MAVGNIEMAAGGKIKRMTLEATVIRADGTVEVLGVISDSSPWHRLLRNISRFFS